MEYEIPEWARAAFTWHHATVDGQHVPYLAGGTGRPVVMIHGLSASLDWWQLNATELARHARVYLLDLPGFGRLGHLQTIDSIPEHVDWIRAWMDAAALPRATFVGHSMGGHISLRLAARDPDRVDRLVLVAPAGVLPTRRLPAYITPVLSTIRQVAPTFLPQVVRDLRRSSLRTVWRSGQDLIERDVLDLMRLVVAPTLIIWGSDDPIIPASLSDLFAERIPDAELRLLPGAGHLPMIDEPERFNQTVISFLAGS